MISFAKSPSISIYPTLKSPSIFISHTSLYVSHDAYTGISGYSIVIDTEINNNKSFILSIHRSHSYLFLFFHHALSLFTSFPNISGFLYRYQKNATGINIPNITNSTNPTPSSNITPLPIFSLGYLHTLK